METLDPATYAHLAKMTVFTPPGDPSSACKCQAEGKTFGECCGKSRLQIDATQYLRLAHWTANSFIIKRPVWKPWEDEFHDEATFGLLRAVERFRPEDGTKFVTYAPYVIARWLSDRAREWMPTVAARSLDWKADRTAMELHEFLLAPEQDRDLEGSDATVRSLLWLLSEQERMVIVGIFWENKTLRELGAALGVSNQTVANIKVRAMQAMGLKGRPFKLRAHPFRKRSHSQRMAEVAKALPPECRYEDALPHMRRSDCVVKPGYFRKHMAMAHGE